MVFSFPQTEFIGSGAGYFTSKFSISEESIKYISPLVIESIRSIPVKAGNTFTIAEYGCADGGTSMPLMYACVKELKKLYGNNLEIHINYEDKPESDFNSLFYFLQGKRKFIKSNGKRGKDGKVRTLKHKGWEKEGSSSLAASHKATASIATLSDGNMI